MERILHEVSLGDFNYDDENHLVSSRILYRKKNLIVKFPSMRLVEVGEGEVSFLVCNEYDKMRIAKMSVDIVRGFGRFLSVNVDLERSECLDFQNNILRLPLREKDREKVSGLKGNIFAPNVHITNLDLHKGYFKIAHSYVNILYEGVV